MTSEEHPEPSEWRAPRAAVAALAFGRLADLGVPLPAIASTEKDAAFKGKERVRLAACARGLTPTDRFVCSVIAHRCQVDGLAYPSVKRVAKDTGYDPSTVRRSLRHIEGAGVMWTLPQHHRVGRPEGYPRTNAYFFPLVRAPEAAPLLFPEVRARGPAPVPPVISRPMPPRAIHHRKRRAPVARKSADATAATVDAEAITLIDPTLAPIVAALVELRDVGEVRGLRVDEEHARDLMAMGIAHDRGPHSVALAVVQMSRKSRGRVRAGAKPFRLGDVAARFEGFIREVTKVDSPPRVRRAPSAKADDAPAPVACPPGCVGCGICGRGHRAPRHVAAPAIVATPARPPSPAVQRPSVIEMPAPDEVVDPAEAAEAAAAAAEFRARRRPPDSS